MRPQPLVASFDLDATDRPTWTFPFAVTCPECGDPTATARVSCRMNGRPIAVCPTCGETLGDVTEDVGATDEA